MSTESHLAVRQLLCGAMRSVIALACGGSLAWGQTSAADNANISDLVQQARAAHGWSPAYEALANSGDAGIAGLVELLGTRETAGYARSCLYKIGQPALRPIIDALRDTTRYEEASSCLKDIARETHDFSGFFLTPQDRTPEKLLLVRDAWLILFGLEQRPLEPLVSELERGSRSPFGLDHAVARAGPRALPLLLPYLAHHDKDVRGRMIQVCRRMGTEAVPALVERLGDPDPCVRDGAALAIRIPRGQGEVPPALIARLGDTEPDVQKAAARTLGTIAVPGLLFGADGVLVKALGDVRPSTHVAAVEALDAFLRTWRLPIVYSIVDDALLPFQVDQSTDPEYLSTIREDEGCRLAIRFFIKVLEDPSRDLLEPTFRSLYAVPDPLSADILTRLLEDTRPDVREHAAWVLANRRGSVVATGLRPILLKMLADREPPCREAAAAALARQGESVLSDVEPLLSAPGKTRRLAVLSVLERAYPIISDAVVWSRYEAYWNDPPGYVRGSCWVPKRIKGQAQGDVRRSPALRRIRELLDRASNDYYAEVAARARSIRHGLDQ